MKESTAEYKAAMDYRDLMVKINDDIRYVLSIAVEFDLSRSELSKRICRLVEHGEKVLEQIDRDFKED